MERPQLWPLADIWIGKMELMGGEKLLERSFSPPISTLFQELLKKGLILFVKYSIILWAIIVIL